MTRRIAQITTAALAAFFMSGALLGFSSCEAPAPAKAPPADVPQASQAHPWQGMTDEELMAGVVHGPLGEQP